MDKRNAEQCLAEDHNVQAQWSTWYTYPTEIMKDSDGVEFVAVHTDAGKSLDDLDGDTEFWCNDCNEDVLAPPIVDYV